MKSDEYFIGIDSSCYTTSLAVCDCSGHIEYNFKKILPVKDNSLGLRQSEAVFLHFRNYNELLREFDLASFGVLGGVCVSSTPRSVEGSYMPVFCVGETIAYSIASATGAPVESTSHQKGHLFAALIGSDIRADRFVAVHLSGGTSEILLAEKNGCDYSLEIVGGTLDLSAGQLIDRAGVRMGFSFPSGVHVENKAQCCTEDVSGRYKISLSDPNFNLSGVEAQVMRDIDSGSDNAVVCRAIEDAVSRSLSQCIISVCKNKEVDNVLFFGGVICNEYIRESTCVSLEREGIAAHYAEKEYSSDNACGLARHAYEVFNR